MISRPRVTALAVVVLGLLGCSSDDERGTPTDTTPAPEDALFDSGGNGGGGPDAAARDDHASDESPPASSTDAIPTIVPIDWSAFPAVPTTTEIEASTGRALHVALTGRDDGSGTEQDPLRHINAAVARAAPGDRVVVHAGTYEEGDESTGYGVPVDTHDLIVMAAPEEQVTVRPLDGFTYGVRLSGDRVAWLGIDIAGFTTVALQLGGDGTTLEDAVVADVRIEAVAEGIVSYEDLNGRPDVLGVDGLTSSVDGLRLSGVTVSGASVLGISCNVGPCLNARFDDVAVHNRGSDGGDSGADCVAFERGDNLVFHRLETSGCEGDGLDLKASRVLVVGSYIHHTLRNGLKLWRGGDVVNTVVSHTGADAGIVLDGPGTYRLLHTIAAYHIEGAPGAYSMTVAYDTACGIADVACGPASGAPNCCRTTGLPADFAGTLSVEIANSVFTQQSGPVFLPTLRGVRIESCLFTAFAGGDAVIDVRDRGERLSLEGVERAGAGAGNLGYGVVAGFPNEDVGSADETLDGWAGQAGGPLIDVGVVPEAATFPLLDIAGHPRTLGGAPDLGPFEVE